MAKVVTLEPICTQTSIETNATLLSVLLKNDLTVTQACGGRGMCATCHVFVKQGMDSLSPMQRREQRTLEVISTCGMNSRLACQARIQAEGVVVEVPSGMYVSEIEDLESLIGRRAQDDILHPITGKILVEEGKLMTRSVVKELEEAQAQSGTYLAQTQEI
jgi:ferredoxin